jgi:hypothetical protein
VGDGLADDATIFLCHNMRFDYKIHSFGFFYVSHFIYFLKYWSINFLAVGDHLQNKQTKNGDVPVTG